MYINNSAFNYHMVKVHTLVLYITLITQQRTSHTLFMDTVFWALRVPLGSHSTSDPLITTAWVWWTLCPNFVLLATVVPEILTRLGGCDVITPLSFIISIDKIMHLTWYVLQYCSSLWWSIEECFQKYLETQQNIRLGGNFSNKKISNPS